MRFHADLIEESACLLTGIVSCERLSVIAFARFDSIRTSLVSLKTEGDKQLARFQGRNVSGGTWRDSNTKGRPFLPRGMIGADEVEVPCDAAFAEGGAELAIDPD